MAKFNGSAGRWLTRVATVVAALALAACGGVGGGDGGGSASGDGTLRVALTDAPSCYEHVFVTVEKVGVHANARAGDNDAGWRDLTLAAPRRIDLLSLTNGVLEELGSMALPPGDYSQLRLVLAANSGQQPLANAVQPIGGTLTPLKTPSAQQSGLKLQVHFNVESNKLVDFVLDFDACKSVVRRGNSGHYNLKPVIAVTPRVISVGTIEGFVDPSLAAAARVSAQSAGNPVKATAPDAVTGKFVLYPVPVGTYALVLTHPTRVTAAVLGVPVVASAAPTVVGAASAPLLPPSAASAPRAVTGTVSTTPQASASVRAMQSIASTPVEVAFTNADDINGAFALTLPVSAPVWVNYAPTPTPFAFTVDAAAAGLYTLQAASGSVTKSQLIDTKAVVPPLLFTFP